MPVASGVVCAWPSTVASIPAGWTRLSGLDGKYVRGPAAAADSDLVTAFGAANHTHLDNGGSGHTVTANSHTHSQSSGGGTGSTVYNTGGSNTLISSGHSHASNSSGSETVTVNAAVATLSTASNDPPYFEVIWLESDGTPTGIPNGAYSFFDSDTLPTNWTRVQGNKFLKGAAAASGGGGTGGSLDSHSHSESGTHTHTQAAHNTGHASNSDPGASTLIGGGTGIAAADGHVHPLTYSSVTATCNASSVSIGTADGQPPFKKLNTIRNDTLANSLPTSIIALWNGTHAGIPVGWTRVTDMDTFFHKGCNANGEALTTGGSTQHTHSSSTCTTTGPTHNHTITAGGADITVGRGTGTAGVATTGHTHVWTAVSATITFQVKSLTIDNNTSESAYPTYQKLIFIKFSGAVAGADFMRRPGYYGEYSLDSLDSRTYGWLLPRN